MLSFIDMALFAGGRCAGMGEGHYVTLDCATHFIARGEIGVPLDAVVRLVGADARRACLPVGALRAGRAHDAQLHRHAQADPRQDVSGPVAKAYAALVAAGELKPDPDQAKAVAALDRFAACLGKANGSFLSRLFAKPAVAVRGLSVGRGRARQVDADGPRLRQHRRRRPSAAPTSRRSCSTSTSGSARRARPRRATRSSRWPKQLADEVKFLAFDEMMVTNSADAMIMSRLFTALIGEGVAIVTTSNRPPSRPLQGRAQPRAVPAVHRADRAADGGRVAQRPDRLSPRPACRGSTPGSCPTGRKRRRS